MLKSAIYVSTSHGCEITQFAPVYHPASIKILKHGNFHENVEIFIEENYFVATAAVNLPFMRDTCSVAKYLFVGKLIKQCDK